MELANKKCLTLTCSHISTPKYKKEGQKHLSVIGSFYGNRQKGNNDAPSDKRNKTSFDPGFEFGKRT